MKVTLDHNCIIHVVNQTPTGKAVERIVADPSNECFIVEMGASEMRQFGVRPDKHDPFEDLLAKAGLAHLQRLVPLGVWDLTFWDYSRDGTAAENALQDEVQEILFPTLHRLDVSAIDLDSPEGATWVNRRCDIGSMWCHLSNKNDVFLTADGNFTKKTKLPRLLALGAGRICRPEDL
jgi:hypothetical protein